MFKCRGVQLNAPTRFYMKYFLIIILFLSLFCEKPDEDLSNPLKYLETEDFPLYFQKLPYYGVNGRNGLETLKKDVLVDIKGIYVKGKFVSFLRTFNDSGLFYVPLKDSFSYNSETSLIVVRGTVASNGEPYLSEIEIKSFDDIGKIKDRVEENYPLLLNKIKDEIHNPKSKLRLEDIKTWHCAFSDSTLFVYGRTYDLMYEFDIGILLKKDGDTYSLMKIYAREFFKGE